MPSGSAWSWLDPVKLHHSRLHRMIVKSTIAELSSICPQNFICHGAWHDGNLVESNRGIFVTCQMTLQCSVLRQRRRDSLQPRYAQPSTAMSTIPVFGSKAVEEICPPPAVVMTILSIAGTENWRSHPLRALQRTTPCTIVLQVMLDMKTMCWWKPSV
jgi:hypothetical protein